MQAPCGGIFELSPDRITITGATVYRLLSLACGMPCVAASNARLVSRVRLELGTLAPNPGFANVARRLTSTLR